MTTPHANPRPGTVPGPDHGGHPLPEAEFTGPARPYPGGDPYADHRASPHPFTDLPDLADPRTGATVTAASDEFFAEREHLIAPHRPRFDPGDFGPKGKVMDGWETRRRRGTSPDHPHPGPGEHDWALIRLGVPGRVRGLIVDTAHFRGNHPDSVAVDGLHLPGTPSVTELLAPDAPWIELVPRTRVGGHAAHGFPVTASPRLTHLRLRQYPDGGVARLRVHGAPLPDPAWLAALGTFDLLAAEHGGRVEDASDRFYSPPGHTLLPGRPDRMDQGWETRRRRDRGHDWIRYALPARARIRAVEIDTGRYRGNAPGWARLHTFDAAAPDAGDPTDPAAPGWRELLPATRLEPDTVHRLLLPDGPAGPHGKKASTATRVRVEILPDGGLARLRLYGSLTGDGAADLAERFRAALP
ncbi:allantoicase [Streptomyces calidiresistens]